MTPSTKGGGELGLTKRECLLLKKLVAAEYASAQSTELHWRSETPESAGMTEDSLADEVRFATGAANGVSRIKNLLDEVLP